MNISEFDYHLPEGLIAQFPEKERDHSKLMVLHKDSEETEEKRFYELKEFLDKGDILIINDTRVFPARLTGRKKTGGRVEVLLLEQIQNGYSGISWKGLIRSSKRPRPDEAITFDNDLKAVVKEEEGEGIWKVEFNSSYNSFWNILEKTGKTPLPPYINRLKEDTSLERIDRERYQTVFARNRGAVAAPTAGLHFTRGLLNDITEKGVKVFYITLNIGWGTFKPVRVEDIKTHSMHPEYYEIKPEVAKAVIEAREKGSRVIAVGTSVVRALEHALGPKDEANRLKGYTDLFIFPGFEFRVVDAMITNFHLPGSTLLMLVAAFAGKDNVMCAYRRAIENGYRFYSYGDAMLIV